MRARLAVAVTAVIGASLLVSAGPAQAALTVANTNDSGPGSLRQTVAEAGPGETINLPAGTYTLTSGPLKLTKSVTLAGAGSSGTILRSGGAFRVIEAVGAFDATITDLTIREGNVTGSSPQSGSAIYAKELNLTLQRLVVAGNIANANGTAGNSGGIVQGGVLYFVGKSLNVFESSVEGNTITANGGSGAEGGVVQAGVLFGVGTVTIRDSSLSGNRIEARGGQGAPSTEQNGGVIQAGVTLLVPGEPPGPTNISDSTLGSNVIDAGGGPGGSGGVVQAGALLAVPGKAPLNMSNTTVAANVSRSQGTPEDGIIQGGALLVVTESGFPATVLDSTIAANSSETSNPAATAGGVLIGGEARFGNTIIANPVGPAGSENCGVGSPETKVISLGFNIESLNQCGFHAAGDQINTNPLLGPLQSNGGATQTMAPALTSPAIDQGGSFGVSTDQRGIIRPIDLPTVPNSAAAGADGSDVGAVEFQPSNAFTLGKLKRNKKKGTATLTVLLPAPSVGTLTLSGKGLKTQTAAIAGQGEVKLKVALSSKKLRKKLRKKGRRIVGINVTFAPTGYSAATQSRKAKLIKKKRKHKKRHPKHGKR
jgi:hypothetical protein